MVRHCLGRIYLCRCNDYLKCQLIYAFMWGPLTLFLYLSQGNLKEHNVDSSYIWPLSLAAWMILALRVQWYIVQYHGKQLELDATFVGPFLYANTDSDVWMTLTVDVCMISLGGMGHSRK
ncbi:hypothetical protein CEXT_567611 [Caerostris extrusa]|uniref:Uncharacterized protein n=1 Tax=Caerostris extrusa TaxID=172846 RepID=A0AAV4SW77_CAEEX|nr:hypothetical protein CEXT_567611 [Caerostris extrusa]